MKKVFALTLSAIILLSACKKNKHDVAQDGVFKGPEVSVGNGKAWSWIQVDDNNKPVSMGVSISSAAMNSLPQGHNSHHGVPFLLKLPVQKALTPFEHVGLDWNPHGHEPEFIYGAAHFDFHFYMISETERMAIPPYEADSAKFKNSPAAGYLPPMYMNFGGGAPQMGAHWVDITSPELNQEDRKPFTQTFIYGSYDGKVNFMEPMITKAFLDTANQFERAIPQPAKFQKTGYYPTKMKIVRKNNETQVVLNNFVFRQKQ
jgi:hypothetical protein